MLIYKTTSIFFIIVCILEFFLVNIQTQDHIPEAKPVENHWARRWEDKDANSPTGCHSFIYSFDTSSIQVTYSTWTNASFIDTSNPTAIKTIQLNTRLHDTSIFSWKRALCMKPHIQIWHYSLLKNAHLHTRSHTRGTEQEMMSPTQPGEMRSAQKTIRTNLMVIHCPNIRSSVDPTVCKQIICMQRMRAEVM